MSTPVRMMLAMLLAASAPSGTQAAAFDMGNLFGRAVRKEHSLAIPLSTPKTADKPVETPVQVSSVRDSKGHMLTLSRETFATTVMKDDSPVEHWVVKFCVASWQCRSLNEMYKELGATWQKSLNFNVAANLPIRFANMVRFAQVDCTKEKQLCAEQGVNSYPSVAHFHRKSLSTGESKISATHMWSGETQSFTPWLEGKLSGKVAKSAQPSAGKETVKLPTVAQAAAKPPNAWEQGTAELPVMLKDFLDKKEVPPQAVWTALLAVSLALAATFWRQRSPSPAPLVQEKQSHTEMRRVPQQQASATGGSMEI